MHSDTIDELRQPPAITDTDFSIQDQLLPGVSRTFALTIPQLPADIRPAITNAYLLCRIADTIEDDDQLDAASKTRFAQQFIAVTHGDSCANAFATQLAPVLSKNTPPAEVTLIQQTPAVIHCLQRLNPVQQHSLQRCVKIMSQGMAQFQSHTSLGGLANLDELSRYCYYVAGVVGEMLTEVFCDYSPAIAKRRQQLMPLAVSFGQGLQMTNVLKDVWNDYQRGVSWYPRDVFQQHNIDLTQLPQQHTLIGFETGLKQLIAIALGHIHNALDYTLLIPADETGIRRFCLWSLGLAILTLRKLYRNPKFSDGQQVKVTRRTVKATIVTTNLCASKNILLKSLFSCSTAGLPETPQAIETLFTEWFDNDT